MYQKLRSSSFLFFSLYLSFFESLWIESSEPLEENLLTSMRCCSNVNLSKFLFSEMISELTNVYSSTENIILFGDYNIKIFKKTGKELLSNFIADNGLQYVNTKKQRGQMEKKFL